MYKATHQNFQRRADALTPKNLANGELVLTPKQSRDSLVSVWKNLEAKLKAERRPSVRSMIGQQMQEIQNQIRAIRPKIKGPRSVESHFILVAKERLTAFQYKAIMNEASERARESETTNDSTGEVTK